MPVYTVPAVPNKFKKGKKKMKKAFVVKTADGYLCPRDGDVGWTPKIEGAGHFYDEGEASDTAMLNGYSVGEFEVLPVAVARLNRGQ